MAVAALCTVTAGAQRLNMTGKHPKMQKMETASAMLKAGMTPQKKKADEELVVFSTDKVLPSKAPRRAEDENTDPELIAWYQVPDGSLFWAMNEEWMVYSVPIVQTPALIPQKFYNTTYASDEETEIVYQWTVMGSSEIEMEQDEENNGSLGVWGYYEAPKLAATQGDLSSEHILTSYTDDTKTGYWYAGTDTITELSHSCYAMGFWGGFSNLDETFTSNTVFRDEKKVTGFMETFEACQDTVYATSLYILGWLENCDNMATPLGDNELKAEIFLVNEDGTLAEEPYATAYASNDDINVLSEEYGSTTISFPFVEEDEIFGSVESAVILPRQDFIIVFSGFENMEGNFTVPFSSASDGGAYLTAGHSYVLLDDGSFATIGYRNYPNVPQINLYIGVNAAVPVATTYFDDVKVEFAAEAEDGEDVVWGIAGYDEDDGEPYGEIYILTGTPYDDENEAWQVEGTEWVTGFYVDNSLFEKYNIVTFYLCAEPLPEGVKGRSGEISFILYGKEVKVTVVQGEVEMSVKGDVTGDGMVNALDIQTVINIAASGVDDLLYDINGDGTVNALDIQEVINIAAVSD